MLFRITKKWTRKAATPSAGICAFPRQTGRRRMRFFQSAAGYLCGSSHQCSLGRDFSGRVCRHLLQRVFCQPEKRVALNLL